MKRIISVILFLIGLFIIIHLFYYEKKIKEISQQIYVEKSVEIKKLFNDEVEQKFGRTSALTYLLSKDPILIEALLTNNTQLLDYSETIKNIEKYGGYSHLWIQVIDKKGYSFHRSWTNKIGDHAASARIDIQDMIKNPQPMQGISTGRFDMTFKTMLPLFHQNEFVGMIEVISKFNSIAQLFKEKNIEPLFVLHESYTKRFIKPFSGLFIGNNYVSNLNASKELMKEVEQFGLEKFLYIQDYMLYKHYMVTTEQIKDVHGGEMGFFIFFINEKDIPKKLIYDFTVDYFYKLIIIGVILLLILLYWTKSTYAKNLALEVENKTSKIKKQQEQLKELLTIYDKNVIFSQTDTKGVITHASSAFCKISGYDKNELIGKPHSIVRHPDMPKEIFQEMWEIIKQGKIWEGEVKNLKKDGKGFYWVDAEIQPVYDKQKNIVGYSAVRQDITDSKEIEEIQREIIFTMGSIGESRSEETGNHVKRVSEYSKILALKYGMSFEEAQMIAQASPMHDIGKVGIADSILKKPGKLDDQERQIMQTHVDIGYNMLKNSERSLLKTAAIIAHQHHEKWDGTGYPRGLKEEQIHIYGRITALADVFDALGSNRCYKEAWKLEDVLEFIKNQKGKHFDPHLVDIFFENLKEFLEVRDSFKD